MIRLATPIVLALLLANAACSVASGGWEGERSEPDPKELAAWRRHQEAGDAARRDRRFEEAEREFLAAIGSITTIAGRETEILCTLRRLADLYREGGRPEEAQAVLEKALAFASKRLGPDHAETRLVQETIRPATRTVSIADDLPELQDQSEKREFRNNVNLWPVLESTTLPTGEHRTALWPLFHWTLRPDGEVYSWHVLNFLSGPRYHMLLPLYYSVDDELSFLPLLTFIGPDYWTSLPILSWSRPQPDGGRSTWLTPLFHETTDAAGNVRSLHAGIYFEGPDWWMIPPAFLGGPDYWGAPPLLSGSWTYPDGDRTTWVTPLFHVTRNREGTIRNFHAGIYLEGENSWSVPPLLTWHRRFPNGDSTTWVTPLFHWTEDLEGGFVSVHGGLYFEGRDYWMLLPLAGGGTHDDGSTTLWLTPLYHRTVDKNGTLSNVHVGPYLAGRDWWTIPPLLTYGWEEGKSSRMTTAMIFWLNVDPEGLASATLCPVFFYVRDSWWFITPLVSGHWKLDGNGETTWITPFFHRTLDRNGELESYHLGVYFEGKDFWAVPPLLSWHVKYEDRSETTWLTPLFHRTLNPEGDLESTHLFPVFLWKRDDYWAAPALLSMGWRHDDGGRTTWITPLFHLTQDAEGAAKSLHFCPLWFWERNSYWAIPPLLSCGGRHADGSQTTWITPFFHDRISGDGELLDLDLLPFWSWSRGRHWIIPPLLVGGGTHADGGQTTWITPLYHHTLDRAGDVESLHAAPFYFWKRDEYWVVPALLSWGSTAPDRKRTTWITPLYHESVDANGRPISRHALTYFEGEDYHHLFPVFWDWKKDGIRHSLVPPVFVRTEEENGDVTTSLPWPLVTVRQGQRLDTSIGMELRPFVYQEAGDQYEFNFLWRLVSVLSEEKTTRVMVGPLWHSETPNSGEGLMEFKLLGGLFARDCNYETQRFRHRIFWFIQVGSPQSMKADALCLLDLHPVWGEGALARAR